MNIKSMTMQELAALLKELGQPAFRAKQIYEWIHIKHVKSFEEMTNIILPEVSNLWMSNQKTSSNPKN